MTVMDIDVPVVVDATKVPPPAAAPTLLGTLPPQPTAQSVPHDATVHCIVNSCATDQSRLQPITLPLVHTPQHTVHAPDTNMHTACELPSIPCTDPVPNDSDT